MAEVNEKTGIVAKVIQKELIAIIEKRQHQPITLGVEAYAAGEAEGYRRGLEDAAKEALGVTGPGNTPEQCQGYSDACRDAAAAIRALGKAEEGTAPR